MTNLMFKINSRNSWMMGSLISAGRSFHFGGRARSLLTLCFALAPPLLRFGHPGRGHVVSLPRTDLQRQLLHTLAPRATWSSRRPYCDAWLRDKGRLWLPASTIVWHTAQGWGPSCLPLISVIFFNKVNLMYFFTGCVWFVEYFSD